MSNETEKPEKNVTCPICGGATIHTVERKTQKYLCQNNECSTKLVVEKECLFMDETKKKDSDIWKKYRYKRFTLSQWNVLTEGGRFLDKEHEVPKECESCGKTEGLSRNIVNIKGKYCCNVCAEILIDKAIIEIPITTTLNIDGYKVKRYVDIESVEIIIGTGIFSEFSGGIADFFGSRSTAFERKLQNAKKLAFKTLKYRAFEKGGNAIVGIDIDYTEFSGNRIGLIANGTIVEIVPISREA